MQCDLTGNKGVNEIDVHPKKYHQRWIDSIGFQCIFNWMQCNSAGKQGN